MITLLVALLSWVQAPSTNVEPPRLVAEKGFNAAARDGVLELRSGRGWLRVQRPVLDFDLQFEIRAVTPDAEPGLVVRTWIGWELWPDKGYRVTLPLSAEADPSSLLVARRQKMTVLQPGKLDVRPAGEWQRVQVVGAGPRIRVVVNDTLAGEFAVENHGGFIMFDSRKGRVDLRNMTLRASDLNEAIPSDIRNVKQIQDSGGRGPEVILEAKPVYSPEAMRAMVQGVVSLEAVVLSDGSVGPARVIRSLHQDLDISAAAALKAWRFRPATLNGSPVPVVVEVDMTFRLK